MDKLFLLSLAFVAVEGAEVVSGVWTTETLSSIAVHSNLSPVANVSAGSLLDCGDACQRSEGCLAFCVVVGEGCYHGSRGATLTTTLPADSSSSCYVNGCPVSKGYIMYSGRCLKLSDETVSYSNAEAACLLDGGHLYDLTTDPEDSAMSALAAEKGLSGWWAIWVGATGDKDNGFLWSDGSALPLDSHMWLGSNPDGANTVWCVELTDYLTLNDNHCWYAKRYLCTVDQL